MEVLILRGLRARFAQVLELRDLGIWRFLRLEVTAEKFL
jgi:hypothetical protein